MDLLGAVGHLPALGPDVGALLEDDAVRGHQLPQPPRHLADLVVVVGAGERGQVRQRRLQPLPVLGGGVRLSDLGCGR